MAEENASIELSINRWHVVSKRLEQKIQESTQLFSRTARFATPLFGITPSSFERWNKSTQTLDELIVQIVNMRAAQGNIRSVIALASAQIAAKMSQETSARKLHSDFTDMIREASGSRSISDVADLSTNIQNGNTSGELHGVNISVCVISPETLEHLNSESDRLMQHSFALQEEIADLNSQKVMIVFDNIEQRNCVNSCLGRS